MNGLRILAVSLALAACGHLAHAQMAASDARVEGEAIAKGVRDTTSSGILGNGSAANVPGFQGTDIPSRDYVDDPVGLTAAGEAQRYRDEYRVIVDPYRTRFDSDTVDLSAGRLIEADPDAYLARIIHQRWPERLAGMA